MPGVSPDRETKEASRGLTTHVTYVLGAGDERGGDTPRLVQRVVG